MTTFQAIVYGILQSFTEFLPIGGAAQHSLVSYLVGWPAPGNATLGALDLGSFLALFIYFRHDWASMISSLLQIVIFRRKPMTVDERMPLFVLLAAVPAWLGGVYIIPWVEQAGWTPLWIAGGMIGFSIPLIIADTTSRKTKNVYDWNILDALMVGLAMTLLWIPGAGILTIALSAALFRNYKRDTATKFAFFTAAPLLGALTVARLREIDFHASSPGDLSWLSFGVAATVTLLCSLLVIGGFLKRTERKGFAPFIVYRWMLAIGVGAFYWLKG